MSRIYVASSWRNPYHPDVIQLLRGAGHEVYDFRSPNGNTAFHWTAIDPEWQGWDAESFRNSLSHPLAQAGFASDFDGMKWADTFVLLLPCGRSSHLELGWAIGNGRRTVVLLDQRQEPELMYLLADRLVTSTAELLEWLGEEL